MKFMAMLVSSLIMPLIVAPTLGDQPPLLGSIPPEFHIQVPPAAYFQWLSMNTVLLLQPEEAGKSSFVIRDFRNGKPIPLKSFVIGATSLDTVTDYTAFHGYVAWISRRDIYNPLCVSNLDGTELRTVNLGKRLHRVGPVWMRHAHGDKLIVYNSDSLLPTVTIWPKSLKAAERVQHLYDVDAQVCAPCWATVGMSNQDHLLLTDYGYPEHIKIRLCEIDPHLQPISVTKHDISVPSGSILCSMAPSPTDKKLAWLLAFGTDASCRLEVWSSNFDGTDMKMAVVPKNLLPADQLNSNLTGGFQWLPNGKAISFSYGANVYVYPMPSQ